jgi:alcohol dehydrogenase
VHGARSFARSPAAQPLFAGLLAHGLSFEQLTIESEPSPEDVDEAVRRWRGRRFDGVVGIGGGSTLDAAKAIAALLRPGNSVLDHLEGIGPERPYAGPATPFIAVPTTAGTGSEATRNAVLSRHGPDGFKKSFRDDQLVAEFALVDPDLLATCPPALIAANGMDAFTQLLEAFVSLRGNPISDALALDGLRAACGGLVAWYQDSGDAAAREKMAYASLTSGVCLAQAGLGSVHGLAQPLGSLFPIPHGVVCGTLVAAATRVNIDVMRARDRANPALARYAQAGRLVRPSATLDDDACDALVETLTRWTLTLALPTLGALGVGAADVPRIVAGCRGSSMKTNPVTLTDAEVGNILAARL